jgi:hypothetical protein
MRKLLASWATFAVLGAAGLAVLPATAPAQDAKAPATQAAAETEQEQQEGMSRRRCAVAICATLHNGKRADGHLTCSLRKSWRKEVLTRILARGKVSWPWGDARCVSDLKFDRATLIRAMKENDFEAQFEAYDIRCQVDNDKDTYDVATQVRPRITFKQGKAVKAVLNWGKIEAPTIAKSALWSITAVDNTFGLLQSMAVEDINKFIGTKCMEYKDEWQGK